MKQLYKRLLLAIGVFGLWLGVNTLVSAQTPVLLKSGNAIAGNAIGLVSTPDGLFFSLDGYLWKTDGTQAGTAQVKNLAGQPVSYITFSYAVVNGRFYFVSGSLLMYVDNSGTARVVNTAYNGSIRTMASFDNQLYFSTDGFSSGNPSLWRTYGDGTQTSLIDSYRADLYTLKVYNNRLYFLTSNNIDPVNSTSLWQIAGNSTGAELVKMVNISSGSRMDVANGFLYFYDESSSRGERLYQSDGTSPGTFPILVPDPLSTDLSSITWFNTRVVNSQLYLRGYNFPTRSSGRTIFKVNLSSRTLEVANEIYGQLPSTIISPYGANFSFGSYKGLFYFSAGANGLDDVELWRSDGTLVKDIQTGAGSSNPGIFYVYNGLLYFTAEGDTGRELYRTDGTNAGTQLVADLVPGMGSSFPGNLIEFKSELYFTTGPSSGGLITLWKLQNNTPSPPATGLTLVPPAYDCNTGQLTLSTTGGNGQAVEYRIAGLRDWAASNSFTIPTYQRTGTSFTLEARQSGQVVILPFATACQSTTPTPPVPPTPPAPPVTPPAPPTGTGLGLAAPAYDCSSGQLQLSTTGGNGQLVEYRIAGLRDWAASNSFTVPAYQLTGTSFTLEARQSGQVVSLAFTSACQTSTTPPTPPVTPPTPPPGSPLTVSAQSLNCQTGVLQLVTAGGDGTAVAYKVPGLGDYTASGSFTVPTYQRSGTNFTLYARQSGREVTATYTATCPVGARLATPETASAFEVVVYPNPVGEQFTVGVRGAAGSSVRFQLTNLSGQTVVDQRASVVSDVHSETLRLPASGSGLYLLRVSTNDQSKTVKVLKL